MRKLTFFISLFICLDLISQTDTIHYFVDSDLIAWKGQLKNEKPTGTWTIYCKSQKPAFQFIFNDKVFTYIEYDEISSTKTKIIEVEYDTLLNSIKKFRFFIDKLIPVIAPYTYGRICSPYELIYPEYYQKILFNQLEHFSNGSYSCYFPNGQIHYKIFFKRGFANGNFISYYDNGEIESIGKMRNNQKIGYWKYFYSNGKIKSKGKHSKLLIYERYSANDSLVIKSNFNVIEEIFVGENYKKNILAQNPNNKYLIYYAQEMEGYKGKIDSNLNFRMPFGVFLKKDTWKEYDSGGKFTKVHYKDGIRVFE